MSLNEVSESVGFHDYFYFIKKFRREVGVTPGKFLQHEKGAETCPPCRITDLQLPALRIAADSAAPPVPPCLSGHSE